MNTVRTSAVASAAVVSLLLASGCGLIGNDEPDETLSIQSIFGLGGGGDWDPNAWRDQEVQIQYLVAECMQEKGWEYIPVIYPDEFYDTGDYDPSSERERIEREGFGIVYWNLYGDEAYEQPSFWDDFVDPNQDYIESLSVNEQQQYYEDLHGSSEQWEEDTIWEIDPDTGEEVGYSQSNWGFGCQGEAYEKVYGEQEDGWNEDLWEAMSVFYEELEQRVQADPRIVELQNTWATCIGDAGFDFRDQDDFWNRGYQELWERYESIAGSQEWVDPMEGWTEQQMEDWWATATQQQIDDMFSWTPPEYTPEQRSQLEALLQDEITLALADWDCSQGHWDKYTEIAQEIEERYVRENQPALEEAAARAQGTS